MKYRKKPVVIEAVQFHGNFDEIEEFVGGDAEWRDGELIVATLEGPLHASPMDYIIKGVKGEFYPCKPDIFKQTYEPAEQQSKRPVKIKERTHFVFKQADVAKFLSGEQLINLARICGAIENGRGAEGKNPSPKYYICNADEPYAEKILEAILDGEAEKTKTAEF